MKNVLSLHLLRLGKHADLAEKIVFFFHLSVKYYTLLEKCTLYVHDTYLYVVFQVFFFWFHKINKYFL